MTAAAVRPGRLDDKVVLITGAAQGIGFATAELAAREVAHVVIGDTQIAEGRTPSEPAPPSSRWTSRAPLPSSH
jgi:NAD(P)-dependent dehydrogenase (short-subunit alcohol dehydrogenase family)